jgi:hypothetical protein
MMVPRLRLRGLESRTIRSAKPQAAWKLNMPPRRIIDILWSMLVAWGMFHFGLHQRIWAHIVPIAREQMLQRYITIPAFLAIYFACWAILCLPVNALGRRFSLRAWLATMLQRGLMFVIVGSLLLICQILSPTDWWRTFEIILLIFVLTISYFAAEMIPPGALGIRRADETVVEKIRATTGTALLPEVFVADHLQSAMCLGIGHRKVLIVPQDSIDDQSQLIGALRNRSRVQLLKAIMFWIWLILGLHLTMRFANPKLIGSPLLVAYLGAWMSAWMGAPLILLRFASRTKIATVSCEK